MGVDIWEVIEAAKTKPFGFMPFYPGPGLGGHCIPIDPFYLTWKAREYGIATRFIELSGEINTRMPHHVVGRLAETMDRRLGKGMTGARILLLGLAYKRNVDDLRESPSLKLMNSSRRAGPAWTIMTRSSPLCGSRASMRRLPAAGRFPSSRPRWLSMMLC